MKYQDTFSGFHPVNNFLYFGLVLLFSMFFMHPACLAISLAGALAYMIYLDGRKGLRFALTLVMPMMLMAALINPAFNHEGATLLAYLPGGNPLTLESMVYGAAAASMLAAVAVWFSCYSRVMTSDKFVYLFGRIIPSMSLVLSMTLRLIPRLKIQLGTISAGQRALGRESSSMGLLKRTASAIAQFSILVTWALENAIETADSMKSRGYGLPGRTAFSIYRFDDRDKGLLLWLCFCGLFIAFGWLSGACYFRYYPTIRAGALTPFSASVHAVYLGLCLTPLWIDLSEDRKWKHFNSQI